MLQDTKLSLMASHRTLNLPSMGYGCIRGDQIIARYHLFNALFTYGCSLSIDGNLPRLVLAAVQTNNLPFPDSVNEVPLQVVVWPLHGRPGLVKIQRSSPDVGTWIRAQVTFRKISNSFVVLFRAESNNRSGKVNLAIDDVAVSEGSC